jgi:probable rRNA maturation factor
MSGELTLRNRQRSRAIDLRLLRRILRELLSSLLELEGFDLAFHFVNDREMTRLNENYLHHAGSTDVITFDYSNAGESEPVAGEIFICVDEALTQARRFHTTWQAELTRYIIHGLLHLHGHDDLQPVARRRMKKEEGRLLKELGKRFRLSKLERKPTLLR